MSLAVWMRSSWMFVPLGEVGAGAGVHLGWLLEDPAKGRKLREV